MATKVSESIDVQVTDSSIGRAALNGYRRYQERVRNHFPLFGEVLLIPSFVGPNLNRYTAWQRLFGTIG